MLDLRKGHADGAPPMTAGWHRGIDPTRWARERDDAYERFCAELDLLESELPADVDPESPAGTAHFARLPLDPYAATDPAEFFAVSSEIYFTNPARLQAPFPAWFELLDRYYRAPTREI
jgi:Mlc titration factor MtfA (ptsG expression regulator)